MTYHIHSVVQIVVKLLTAVAAANWGIVEFFGTDLLKDVLALSGQNYKIAVAVLAIAAALVAIEAANDVGDR